jgi:hypothetical protein
MPVFPKPAPKYPFLAPCVAVILLMQSYASDDCLGMVQLMSMGASMMGCKAYLDSQKQACKCVIDSKSRDL